MIGKLEALASAGPTDRVLKDARAKLRSFSEVMYEFFSWDARRFIVDHFKESLDNPPQSLLSLPADLQEKAWGLFVLELVTKFCEKHEEESEERNARLFWEPL